MKQVVVVGAGTMGNGIAHVFALGGWQVTLVDAAPAALEKALATIKGNLERQARKGTIEDAAVAATLGRIVTRTSLAEAGGAAALAVEAVSENPAVKFKVFEELDRVMGPDAILASNTSSISITEIAPGPAGPAR